MVSKRCQKIDAANPPWKSLFQRLGLNLATFTNKGANEPKACFSCHVAYGNLLLKFYEYFCVIFPFERKIPVLFGKNPKENPDLASLQKSGFLLPLVSNCQYQKREIIIFSYHSYGQARSRQRSSSFQGTRVS